MDRRAHRRPGRRGRDPDRPRAGRGLLRHRRARPLPETLAAALAVDVEEWKAEIPQITEWFEKFGDDLPAVLWTELDGLKARLGL
ncbi:phosphoenolpyruvate carboxykinase domain-containing protein [Nocardioides zeae]